MGRRIKGIARYDGGYFAGWQVQPGERTVQGALEEALAHVLQHAVRIHGAGRTDAGVHALAQTFHFDTDDAIPLDRLRRSISSMLAPEIRVETFEEAAPEFHARYAAKSKRYAYSINLAREADPFTACYAWTLPREFDLARLRSLMQRFEGEHDFAGYRCAGTKVEDTVRTIYSAKLIQGGVVGPVDAEDLWRIELHGTGFLYKMVRNIVGTLADIVRGQLDASVLGERLGGSGPYDGYTAPAHGLALVRVYYE